jgi:hypothetical protein
MAAEDSIRKEIKSLERQLDKFTRESAVTDAEMRSDIGYIKEAITKLNTLVAQQYVTRTEFEPVKKLVYGTVAIMLTAVMGGLMTLIIIR